LDGQRQSFLAAPNQVREGGGAAVTIRVPPPTHSTARPRCIFQPGAWPLFSKEKFNPQPHPLPFQNDYAMPE
jgi:hypothetical protein